eukprot:Tbor_TRINITY_DN6044_c0_g1::TRINITY_DN6044_c0_g1_i1::g.11330::m.11330
MVPMSPIFRGHCVSKKGRISERGILSHREPSPKFNSRQVGRLGGCPHHYAMPDYPTIFSSSNTKKNSADTPMPTIITGTSICYPIFPIINSNSSTPIVHNRNLMRLPGS